MRTQKLNLVTAVTIVLAFSAALGVALMRGTVSQEHEMSDHERGENGVSHETEKPSDRDPSGESSHHGKDHP